MPSMSFSGPVRHARCGHRTAWAGDGTKDSRGCCRLCLPRPNTRSSCSCVASAGSRTAGRQRPPCRSGSSRRAHRRDRPRAHPRAPRPAWARCPLAFSCSQSAALRSFMAATTGAPFKIVAILYFPSFMILFVAEFPADGGEYLVCPGHKLCQQCVCPGGVQRGGMGAVCHQLCIDEHVQAGGLQSGLAQYGSAAPASDTASTLPLAAYCPASAMPSAHFSMICSGTALAPSSAVSSIAAL